MRIKRIIFWIILAVSLGVAAWWATYVPYDPERLYRAVPNNAWWVSEHNALAARWNDTVRSPLLDVLPGAVGMDAGRLDAALHDPVVSAAVARLARRKVVLAGVPWLGESARPAWVGATWVGVYGQVMRWGLAAPWLKGVERVALADGWRGWAWTDPEWEGRTLSLAVVDGILLGCFSEDPRGVQVLIDRLQRGAPILDALREERTEPAAPDRVWMRWANGVSAGSGPRSLEIAVTESGPAGWHGWIAGDALRLLEGDRSGGNPERPAGPVPVRDLDARLNALARLLGDAPDAIAVLPSAVGERVLERPGVTHALRDTSAILLERAAADGLGFVALFGGPYSGRMLGIRVPSVMAGVCLAGNEDGLETVSAALDRVNAARGWGLIPRPIRVGGLDAVVVDSSRGGVYGSLADGERPVLAVIDGWFVACSSVRTLERCAAERAARPAAPAAAWAAGVRAAGGQEYLWLDPGAAGDAIKKALAAYALVRLVQRADARDTLRGRLDLLRACIESLAPIQAAELWMARDRPEPALRFRLSTAVPDDGA
jgi:hypothetical protein